MKKRNWIKVKSGLFYGTKHKEAMGESVWLFGYMLDIVDWETGFIVGWKDAEALNYLNSFVDENDKKWALSTLRKYRQRLDRKGYITCHQKYQSIDIEIHNYHNPRQYEMPAMNDGNQISTTQNDDSISEVVTHPVSNLGMPTSSSHLKHTIKGVQMPKEWTDEQIEQFKLAMQGVEFGEYQVETHPYLLFLWEKFSIKPAVRHKDIKHWEAECFELKRICGEFGIDALHEWYDNGYAPHMRKNGGVGPFNVNGPQSLTKALTGYVGIMRQKKAKPQQKTLEPSPYEIAMRKARGE